MTNSRVLLIGSGGRESAMLSALLKSDLLDICYFSPGIPQVYSNGKLKIIDIDVTNHDIVVSFCKKKDINLVIVGYEVPLCSGIVDTLEANNIATYGPNMAASQLESSKIFMKDVLQSAGIPTAKYATFSHEQLTQAQSFINTFTGKIVIKTDGLANGKGVYICDTQIDANSVLQEFFNGKFDTAGKNVVIEEYLEGSEVSVFALCDGKKAVPFFHACDYKKIGNGDAGLNTGGMGSFAPSFLEESEFYDIVNKYFNATLSELKNRGIEYKGFLYGGLILTQEGIKFLEYNVRMGDPETQSILSLLDCDFLHIIRKSYDATLDVKDIKFKNQHSITLVFASKGYPLNFEKHKKIIGLNSVLCSVYPSGLYQEDEEFYTNGGRVLSLVAIGDSQKEARELVYKEASKIAFDGIYYRNDIGK